MTSMCWLVSPRCPMGSVVSLLARLVRRAAVHHRLDPRLLDALVRTESAYDPAAISPAGAMGLMQLMPATARRFGVRNPFAISENLAAGCAYLVELFEEFGADDEGLLLVLAAYNAGAGAVRRYGGLPPYDETRSFVARVIVRYLGRDP